MNKYQEQTPQIEKSNQIIQNIEERLTNLFKKKDIKYIGKDYLQNSINENTNKSSTSKKDLDVYLSQQEQDNSNIQSNNLQKSNTDILMSFSPNQQKQYQIQQSISNNERISDQYVNNNLTSNSQMSYSNKQNVTQLQQPFENIFSQNKQNPKQSGNYFTESPNSVLQSFRKYENNTKIRYDNNNNKYYDFNKDSNQQVNVFERMHKLEDHYIQKIQIIDEKMNYVLEENNQLNQENQDLQQTMQKYQREFELKHKMSLEDASKIKNLQNQIEKLHHEKLQMQNQHEQNMYNIQAEAANYQEELKIIKQQKLKLNDEKQDINQSYNNLLELYNQLLQIDIQKNEKCLINNSNMSYKYQQKSYQYSPYVPPSQKIISNLPSPQGKYSMVKLQMGNDQMNNSSNNVYKDEVDKIKIVNQQIIQESKKEINLLKDELGQQKQRYSELQEQLELEKSIRTELSPLKKYSENKNGYFLKIEDGLNTMIQPNRVIKQNGEVGTKYVNYSKNSIIDGYSDILFNQTKDTKSQDSSLNNSKIPFSNQQISNNINKQNQILDYSEKPYKIIPDINNTKYNNNNNNSLIYQQLSNTLNLNSSTIQNNKTIKKRKDSNDKSKQNPNSSNDKLKQSFNDFDQQINQLRKDVGKKLEQIRNTTGEHNTKLNKSFKSSNKK